MTAPGLAAAAECAWLGRMKPMTAALLSLVVLCGVFAPFLTGCSDEKTASPPTSPTSEKQAVSNPDGGGGGGGGSTGGGGGRTGGGW
jgi:uncharacterized membrane protein YgcG